MFSSTVLDVAIGVIFVFLLVSILCTAIREGIEAWLKTRAAYLEYGIRELLHDKAGTGLAATVFNHPLINGLFTAQYQAPREQDKPGMLANGDKLPSYIPSRNFALALMDIAARGPNPAQCNDAGAPIITLDQMRAGVSRLANGPVQRALLTAIDTAQGDLDRAQKNIEDWYDSVMDRISGWYKRSSQIVILIIGFAIAFGCNINAVTIADHLYKNGPARAALVQQAEKAAGDQAILKEEYGKVIEQIGALELPIGWDRAKNRPFAPETTAFWAGLPGWVMTALAAMLGAPFWFDMLNKLMVVRSTVKPREKSPEEASEDRQLPASYAPGAAAPAAAGVRAAHGPQDCCDLDMAAHPTDDEQLPAARGGVAPPPKGN